MCGIAGIFDRNGKKVEVEILHRMSSVLKHRGPDGHGEWVYQNVGLANRRLAIIDPTSAGNQPFSTDDGAFIITFNGEIFNYESLRSDLIQKGYHFSSHSDTEVILNGYIHYGEKIVSKLSGQFAFCIFDKKKNCLFLARDQVGINPLYFARAGNLFLFASEIKSLLASERIKKEINLQALHHFLSMFAIPQPLTMIKGIHSLLAGHSMIVNKNGIRIHRYWALPIADKVQIDPGYEALKEKLRMELINSVTRAKTADVRVAAFLSGGVDSSLIVALLSQHTKKLKTYSLWSEAGDSFDERKYASLVAKKYGTDHHECTITQEELIEELPNIVYHFDQPTGGSLETYFISKYASQEVKVALSGLGADELFGGYHSNVYQSERLSQVYRKIPSSVKDFFLMSVKKLPISNDLQKTITVGDLFLKQKTPLERMVSLYFTFTQEEKMHMYQKEIAHQLKNENTIDYFKQIEKNVKNLDIIDRFAYIDLQTYTRDDLLMGINMMSMANSLEARVPFLDPKLIELAFAIPSKYKYANGIGKIILKDVARGFLPPEVIDRKKVGFALPRNRYMRDKLRPYIYFFLSVQSVEKRGLFNSAYVSKLVSDFYNTDSKKMLWSEHLRIWSLFIFEIWCRLYLDRNTMDVPNMSLKELAS